MVFGWSPRPVKHDEEIVFYPSYVAQSPTGNGWSLVVQGCVYNTELLWVVRHPVMAAIRRAMKITPAGREFFKTRMKQFLVGAEEGRSIVVKVNNEEYPVGISSDAGLFRGTIPLDADDLVQLTGNPEGVPGVWINYQAVLPPKDKRLFVGSSMMIARHGVSIISDVDDTIKHSNVPNRRDLFQNTFSREFTPILGMPDLYKECAERNVTFHYVSGSPWQLYSPLRMFWDAVGFPVGSFHLKQFRIRDTASRIRGMSPQKTHKRAAILPILDAFPRRKFFLVGDSGEQDPEIYASVMREYPNQVEGIFIRSVRPETRNDTRFLTAFDGLPAEKCHLFVDPIEIEASLLQQIEQLNAAPTLD